MNDKTKRILNIVVSIIPILIMIVAIIISNMPTIKIVLKWVLLLLIIISSILMLFTRKHIKPIIYKFIAIVAYLTSFGLLIYSFLYKYDLTKYFSSITAIKELILSSGAMGGIIFIIIQIAQVVFLPIPAVALMIVGIIVYGPIRTSILCIIGVLLGSYLSFMVGKTFGYKFISWVVGEEKVTKYSNILRNNGRLILTLVFLFPMLPDDLFCMIAGISPMTFKEFFLIATLVRPITIIVLCAFGGTSILSFDNPLGIIITISILIIAIVFATIMIKKNKRVKSLFLRMKVIK